MGGGATRPVPEGGRAIAPEGGRARAPEGVRPPRGSKLSSSSEPPGGGRARPARRARTAPRSVAGRHGQVRRVEVEGVGRAGPLPHHVARGHGQVPWPLAERVRTTGVAGGHGQLTRARPAGRRDAPGAGPAGRGAAGGGVARGHGQLARRGAEGVGRLAAGVARDHGQLARRRAARRRAAPARGARRRLPGLGVAGGHGQLVLVESEGVAPPGAAAGVAGGHGALGRAGPQLGVVEVERVSPARGAGRALGSLAGPEGHVAGLAAMLGGLVPGRAGVGPGDPGRRGRAGRQGVGLGQLAGVGRGLGLFLVLAPDQAAEEPLLGLLLLGHQARAASSRRSSSAGSS